MSMFNKESALRLLVSGLIFVLRLVASALRMRKMYFLAMISQVYLLSAIYFISAAFCTRSCGVRLSTILMISSVVEKYQALCSVVVLLYET